jgi:hypothetical protein
MLRPVDILVALKILTSDKTWTQMILASQLCLSSSQVNGAIKQLLDSGLMGLNQNKPYPLFAAIEEFLLCGLKYSFPAQIGDLTIGMPTAYAAEPLSKEIMLGNDPIPVWPFVNGTKRGIALEPLHKNVPKALTEFPDQKLYNLLTLIDALRFGKAREKNIAKLLLKSLLSELFQIREHKNE